MKITSFPSYQPQTSRIGKNALADGEKHIENEKRNVDRLDITGESQRGKAEKIREESIGRMNSAERLAALSSAVKNQTYYVPTEKLVDAIFAEGRL